MANVFPEVSGGSPSSYHSSPDQDDIERNLAAADQVVERMAGMLEGLSDTSVMVPRSEWSVGEHGAHIAFTNIGFGMFAMGAEYPYGDGTQAGLAEANDVSLIGFPSETARPWRSIYARESRPSPGWQPQRRPTSSARRRWGRCRWGC